MRRYVMLITFTVTITFWLLITPVFASMAITEVSGIKMDYQEQISTVSCTGNILAENQQVVSFGISIKPKNVYVSIGQTVKPGQKLMDIDTTQTMDALNEISDAQSEGAFSSSENSLESSEFNEFSGSSGTGSDSGSSSNNSSVSSLLSEYYAGTSASSQSNQQNNSNSQSVSEGEDIPESVYSDITGVVTELNVNTGIFTEPTAPLIVISDMSSLQILAQVDAGLISQVKVGQSASITSDAFQESCTGKVSKIYPAAQTIITPTGQQTVVDAIIAIDNQESFLKPGLETNIVISDVESDKAFSLPYQAVGEDNHNQKYVYIYSNGRAYRRNIITGNEYANSVEITSGLTQGEIVIANLPQDIKNGQQVRLISIGGDNNV